MVLSMLVSMDASISLDPLIAEAKRRAHRRRALLIAIALLAGAAALTLALRPWGSGPAEHVSLGAGGNPTLSRLHVPVDLGERHWRSLLPALEGAAAPPAAMRAARVEVARMLKAAGVTLVRIKIWPRTSPPAVELVVATNTDSAIFVHHRFMHLVGMARPYYVRVVDA